MLLDNRRLTAQKHQKLPPDVIKDKKRKKILAIKICHCTSKNVVVVINFNSVSRQNQPQGRFYFNVKASVEVKKICFVLTGRDLQQNKASLR